MKQLEEKLQMVVQELTILIESGNLTPEDLVNIKKLAGEALEECRADNIKNVQLIYFQIIRLLIDFFGGN